MLAALVAKESGVFAILKTNAALGKQADGLFLLPTSQLLQPWGQQFVFRAGLWISPSIPGGGSWPSSIKQRSAV